MTEYRQFNCIFDSQLMAKIINSKFKYSDIHFKGNVTVYKEGDIPFKVNVAVYKDLNLEFATNFFTTSS